MSRYELIERLGHGGMGDVWLATRTMYDGERQRVAVKFINDGLADDRNMRERFKREAMWCMKMHHTNVVKVLDWTRIDDKPAIVMEHIEGLTVADLILAVELSEPVVRRIMRDALAGLQHAHERGILHRDLSPTNIMVDRHGVAKIMDFGMVRELRCPNTDGRALGTRAFLAPEVLRYQQWSRESDMYSLGAVFYALHTGRAPYGHGDRHDVLMKMEEGKHAPLPAGAIAPDIGEFIEIMLQPRQERTEEHIAYACDMLENDPFPVATHEEVAAAIRTIRTKRGQVKFEEASTVKLAGTRDPVNGVPADGEQGSVPSGQAGIVTKSPPPPKPLNRDWTSTPLPGKRRWFALAAIAVALLLGVAIERTWQSALVATNTSHVQSPVPAPVPTLAPGPDELAPVPLDRVEVPVMAPSKAPPRTLQAAFFPR